MERITQSLIACVFGIASVIGADGWLRAEPKQSTITDPVASAAIRIRIPTTTTTTTAEPERPTPPVSRSKPTPPPAVLSVSEQEAKMFIYNHESGNDPTARNGSGCRGLGQACPGSKLTCSDHDYACQDAWFTKYMHDRYGTWNNARQKWILRAYRCGDDWCGGWW